MSTQLLESSPPPSRRRRRSQHYGLNVGVFLFVAIVSVILAAPLLAPYSPYHEDFSKRLLNPIWYPDGTSRHILGTDAAGRDYLSRVLYGGQMSLLIGVGTVIISSIIGVTIGLIGGYFGGKTDLVVSFVITARLSIPVILIATAVSAFAGASVTLLVILLGCLLWDRFAVVARSAVHQIKHQSFVNASRSIGASDLRIAVREILPNILPLLLVVMTMEMAEAITLEAALSFLGLGIQPPTPSWGLMIAEGKGQLLFKPWLVGIPGVAIFLLILSISLIGDGLRDASPN